MATAAAQARLTWLDPRHWSLKTWRYQEAAGRDARLDWLRGCLVLAMLVDHLGGESWLFVVTGGNRFFVSAAEGFVFLSGLVMGLVYARLIEREGLRAATWRAFRRAAFLYGWAIGLGVSTTLVANRLGATWGDGGADPVSLIVGLATLRQGVYLADVLMLYALLVLAAPVALALLRFGRTDVVLAGAVGLWGLYQLGLTAPVDTALVGLEWFPPFAWQLVFAVGLVLGYHWRGLGAWVGQRPWGWALAGLGLAASGLIGLSLWAPASPLAEPVAAVFAKEALRPGRLLAALVFFPLLFGLVTLLWRPLRASLGWLLLPLGRQALLAYGLHLFLSLAANVMLPDLPGYDLNDPARNTLLHLVAIVALWGLIQAVPSLGAAVGALATPPRGRRRAWGPVVSATSLLLFVLPLGGATVPSLRPLAASAMDQVTAPVPLLTPARGAGVALAAPAGPTPITGRRVVLDPPAPPPARRAAPAAPTPLAARRPPAAKSEPAGNAVAAPPLDALARLPAHLRPATGQALERAFYSPTLDRRMDYWIYLPPNYDQSTTRFPVLYLLHGLGGDRREWIDYGLFARAAAMIADGSLPPLLIVLPEGETSYWVNHVNGPAWGDYVADDLVQHIDGRYRTQTDPRARAIGGLSMGAHAALTLAITHPDRFRVAGLHSPSLRPADRALPFFGTDEAFRQRDAVELVKAGRVPAGLLLWLDVGEEDWWLEGTLALHTLLEEQGVAHTWHLFPGVHDGPYWADHLGDYLRYYGAALAASSAAPPAPSKPTIGGQRGAP